MTPAIHPRRMAIYLALLLSLISCTPASTVGSTHSTATSFPSPTTTTAKTKIPTEAPTVQIIPTLTATVFSPDVLEGTPVPVSNKTIEPENAARLGVLAQWGKGAANDLAYSPNGMVLAVASSLGIYLYDASQQETDRITTSQAVTSLIFITDGSQLAAGMQDGTIMIWDLQSLKLVNSIQMEENGPIVRLQISPDGNLIGLEQATPKNNERHLLLIQISPSEILLNLELDYAGSYAFSPDFSNVLVTGETSGGAGVTQYSANQEIGALQSYDIPDDPIAYAISVSPDGKRLAYSTQNTLYLWDLLEAESYKSIQINIESIYEDYSPGCMISAEPMERSTVSGLTFSPDGDLLSVATADGSLQIHRSDDGSLIKTISSARSSGTTIQKTLFSPGGDQIAVLYATGVIEIRDSQNFELIGALTDHGSEFSSAAISPDSQIVAVSTSSGSIDLRNIKTGQKILSLDGPADSLAFSPDGAYLTLGLTDGSVQLWDLLSQKITGERKDQTQAINQVAFTPDGQSLVSLSLDCSLMVWQTEPGMPSAGSLVYDMEKAWMPLPYDGQMAFSPGGNWLGLVGEGANPITLFDIQDLQNARTLGFGISGEYNGLAFSPDGSRLAVINPVQLDLWNMNEEKIDQSFLIAGSQITFSPNGNLLAVADSKGKLILVEPGTGTVLFEAANHRGAITDLAFSPDGRILVTTAKDGTVHVWGVPG